MNDLFAIHRLMANQSILVMDRSHVLSRNNQRKADAATILRYYFAI